MLERLGMRYADRVVVRGTRHAQVLAISGVDATVVHDGVDVQLFSREVSAESIRRRLGIGTEMSVGVLGSLEWSSRLSLCYGWDLVEALAEIRHLPVKGVIIGDGSGKEYLVARAAHLNISDKLIFVGRIPAASIPEYLAAIDVCLSTQTNDLAGQVRTTGKLPLYMAAGRYVLATNVGEAALVLPSEMLLPYEGSVDLAYPRRLAKRLEYLVNNREALSLGHANAKIARDMFDYSHLSRKVVALMESLCVETVEPVTSQRA